LRPVEEEPRAKPAPTVVCGKTALEKRLLGPPLVPAITWVRQGRKLSLRNLGDPPKRLVEEVSRFALDHGIDVERRQFGHATSSSSTAYLRKPNTPPTARIIGPFRSLTATMTIADVVLRCGVPDEDIGSGISIFLYHLQDGSTVSIGAVNQSPITGVTIVDGSGKVTDLLPVQRPTTPSH
jgi:hypothetical protein